MSATATATNTTYAIIGSYWNGEGLYKSLYPKVYETFPPDPCKDNTTPAQNFLALAAAMYMEMHDNGIHPLAFYREHIHRYAIDPELHAILAEYLTSATPSNLHPSMDKLLDLAIFHVYSKRDAATLLRQAKLLVAFQNVLW
jgi:hypothetical protein